MREGSLRQRWPRSDGSIVPVELRSPHTVSRPTLSPSSRFFEDQAELEALAERLRRRNVSRYERLVKPVLDRLAAMVLLILLTPILLFVTITVLVAVGRPVLFRQARAGRNGKPFEMLKFRTMRPDRRTQKAPYGGPDRRQTHKTLNDPRHTRAGRMLRKLSLDELPQLVNVLRGEMSLVGPRPELHDLSARFAPWQQSRHIVKPGVTGLWQTTSRGMGRPLHDCVEIDLYYIEHLTFGQDLLILLRTPVALFRNKGVV